MIIPDANLLVYAHNEADPDHEKALKWWRNLLSGNEEIGIPMAVLMAFVRITTGSRILETPLSVDECARYVESWFVPPYVRLLHASDDHLSRFLQMIRKAGAGGNLTTDAHLAALALEYRAELHSADQDFGRFSGLRWRNPLKDD